MLPTDIHYEIIKHCDGLDRENFRLVCKAFNDFKFTPHGGDPYINREVTLINALYISAICASGHSDIFRICFKRKYKSIAFLDFIRRYDRYNIFHDFIISICHIFMKDFCHDLYWYATIAYQKTHFKIVSYLSRYGAKFMVTNMIATYPELYNRIVTYELQNHAHSLITFILTIAHVITFVTFVYIIYPGTSHKISMH